MGGYGAINSNYNCARISAAAYHELPIGLRALPDELKVW